MVLLLNGRQVARMTGVRHDRLRRSTAAEYLIHIRLMVSDGQRRLARYEGVRHDRRKQCAAAGLSLTSC